MIQSLRFFPSRLIPQNADPEPRGIMLDVITRRGDLELTLQIGAEILGSEDPRNRGDHPVENTMELYSLDIFFFINDC